MKMPALLNRTEARYWLLINNLGDYKLPRDNRAFVICWPGMFEQCVKIEKVGKDYFKLDTVYAGDNSNGRIQEQNECEKRSTEREQNESKGV